MRAAKGNPASAAPGTRRCRLGHGHLEGLGLLGASEEDDDGDPPMPPRHVTVRAMAEDCLDQRQHLELFNETGRITPEQLALIENPARLRRAVLEKYGIRGRDGRKGFVGYGLALIGDHFTDTPHVGFGFSETARECRMGWRLTSAVRGKPGFKVNLDAIRRKAANDLGSGVRGRQGRAPGNARKPRPVVRPARGLMGRGQVEHDSRNPHCVGPYAHAKSIVIR